MNQWVEFEEAKKRLRAMGLWHDMNVLPIFTRNGRIRESELQLINKAAQAMGVTNVKRFLFAHTTARNKLMRRTARSRPRSLRQATLYILKKFYPRLATIIQDPRLKGTRYTFFFDDTGDAPFWMQFSLGETPQKPVARFNFDLFFNRNGKPSVILGNMQGGTITRVKEFKRKLGESPMDFLVSSFRKAFPEPAQIFALNVKHHEAYQKPNKAVIAYFLFKKGKITKDDLFLLDVLHYGEVSCNPSHPAVRKLEAEIKRRRTATIGMHKAAFKKAGFRLNKSRLWRLKPAK